MFAFANDPASGVDKFDVVFEAAGDAVFLVFLFSALEAVELIGNAAFA